VKKDMLQRDIVQPEVEAEDLRKVRQPKPFDRFRCIGADCEDTCCVGWGIPVDQETYDKYQNYPHRIGDKALSSLVEINSARSSTRNFAKIRLEEATCPALHKDLCSIQQALGESYLPDLCSTYPRVLNAIGNAVERSLDVSCPEAARLVLDPGATVFHEGSEERLPNRSGSLNLIAGDPNDRLYQIRTLLIELIQERSLQLWQRIVCLGFAIDRLAGVDLARAVPILENYLKSLRQGSLDGIFTDLKADPAFQMETVLDLVVARIGTDYTSPRFLECYKDFMRGLAWTPESTMEQLADRYDLSSQSIFLPFVRRHEHMLENYLVNYIFGTVFPYRSRLLDRKFAIDSSRESMRHSFVLLAVHYAIIRAMLIGMAALHRDNLSTHHVVKLVQSYSKTFLHSTSFEAAAIEYLEKNVGDPARKVAELVMD
jgi:lysine-N-methylase